MNRRNDFVVFDHDIFIIEEVVQINSNDIKCGLEFKSCDVRTRTRKITFNYTYTHRVALYHDELVILIPNCMNIHANMSKDENRIFLKYAEDLLRNAEEMLMIQSRVM